MKVVISVVLFIIAIIMFFVVFKGWIKDKTLKMLTLIIGIVFILLASFIFFDIYQILMINAKETWSLLIILASIIVGITGYILMIFQIINCKKQIKYYVSLSQPSQKYKKTSIRPGTKKNINKSDKKSFEIKFIISLLLTLIPIIVTIGVNIYQSQGYERRNQLLLNRLDSINVRMEIIDSVLLKNKNINKKIKIIPEPLVTTSDAKRIGNVVGFVKTIEGKNLSNVTITRITNKFQTTSQENGDFIINSIKEDEILRFEKSGYDILNYEVKQSDFKGFVEIKLRELSQPPKIWVLTINISHQINRPNILIDGINYGSDYKYNVELQEGNHEIKIYYLNDLMQRYEYSDNIYLSSNGTLSVKTTDFKQK